MLDRRNLHSYQVRFIEHLKGDACSLGFVEMGLGKTVAVATAIADIRQEDLAVGKKRRFLVIAPKRVAAWTWPREIEKWAHLRHLKVRVAAGRPPLDRLAAVTDPNADIVTLNYENIKWLLDRFPKELPFYGVVFDEIDKLKDVSTKRFTALRYRTYKIPWRVGMTGTPTPEHLLDIWGPVYLVTAEEQHNPQIKRSWPPVLTAALGTSKDIFQSKFFETNEYERKVVPRPGTADYIARKIAPYTYQARASDHLDLPERVINDITYELSPTVMAKYRELEKEFVLELDREGSLGSEDDDEWDSGEDTQVVAANAAVLKNKLRQLCSGFLYYDKPMTPHQVAQSRLEGRRLAPGREAHWMHNAKVDAYRDAASELMGEPHLVVYGYRAELEKMGFEHHLSSRIPAWREEEILRKWDSGNIGALAIHPASAGHGLNLHEGGAHHIFFLTLPWSNGLYHQTIARLHRMGQKKRVVVHRFVAKGTVEEDVVAALESKGEVQAQVIQAIKRRAR